MAPTKPNTMPTQNADSGISSLEFSQVRSKKRFPKIMAAIKPTKAKTSHLPKNFIYNSKIFFFLHILYTEILFSAGCKNFRLKRKKASQRKPSVNRCYLISIRDFFFFPSSRGGIVIVRIPSSNFAEVFSVSSFVIGML